MSNIFFSLDEAEIIAHHILQSQSSLAAFGGRWENVSQIISRGTFDQQEMDVVDLTNIEEELDTASESWVEKHSGHGQDIAQRLRVHLKDVRFHFRFLAEGGANVLFKIELNGAEHLPLLPEYLRLKLEALRGMLLRMRKHATNQHHKSTYIMTEYEKYVQPLFPSKYLLQQKLVRLPEGIRHILRAMMLDADQNGMRLTKWQLQRGTSLSAQIENNQLFSDEYGILVQDLSPRVDTEHLLEFKPKWLVASPSSPSEATRCRTCALRQMRKADGIPRGRGDAGLCPLDLLSGKSYTLQPALRKLCNIEALYSDMITTKRPGEISVYVSDFESEFRRKVQPLLGRLKALQTKHCHVGLKDFERAGADELSLAMALRDCSILMKIDWSSSKQTVEIVAVKVADLDLKETNPGKRRTWLRMEQRLIEAGWYEGKDMLDVDDGDLTCRVSRGCV